jgi:hypothetical protein
MTGVKKFLVAAAAATAMIGVAGAANATIVDAPYNITLVPNGDGTFSSLPWGNHLAGGPDDFVDVATFSIGAPGTADSTLTTILLNGVANIDFTHVWLDNHVVDFAIASGLGGVDNATLAPIVLAAGQHTITIEGNLLGQGGTYSGVLNIGAVPEPATWAMMILGMGMVGFGLRMRRRTAAATV